MEGHIAHMEDTKNAHRILIGKTERKRPLGRPGHRWAYVMKMYK
jgi:hypothetical protein